MSSAPVSIMFTAAGAPQAATVIRHLRANGERDVRLIALDMNEDVVGRYMADAFHAIPKAGAPGYDEALLAVVESERPDAILNCSENDVPEIARLKPRLEALGTRVVCADADLIEAVADKFRLYSALEGAPDVAVPEFRSPGSLDEFVEAARAMGYPDRDLCFKPHRSKGSRGFRVLTERFDRRDLLLNHKPTARYMPLDEFVSIFRDHDDFPELLLMEVAAGDEYDVMSLAHEGEALLTTIKSRESHRWGVIDRAELIRAPHIDRAVSGIVSTLGLSANVFLQFIGDKLIEVGPRTSTYVYAPGFVEPWLSVKLAIGLATPDDIRAYRDRIPYGRRMIRYMDQIFYDRAGAWSA